MDCCKTCGLASEVIFNLTLINGSCHTAKEYKLKLEAMIDRLKTHESLCGSCKFIEDLKK